MIEITQDNYKDITFDGVIAYKRKNPENDGAFNGIGIIFEDAYKQDGSSCAERGQGYRSGDKSWYHSICFEPADSDWCKNGIYYNSTSRLSRDLQFRYFERYEYYKFDNLLEFAQWVLENEKKGE